MRPEKAKKKTRRAFLLLTAPWWRVMSSLINARIFPLMFLSLVQFCLFSKAQAVLAAHCMDLRDSTPEPLTAAAFISGSCSLYRCDMHLFRFSTFTLFRLFFLSRREAVIAWYQSVAHYRQESVPCCMPEGFIGFKWKLWERNKRWAVRKISAVAAGIGQWLRRSWNESSTRKRWRDCGGMFEEQQRRKTNPITFGSEYVKLNKEAGLNMPSFCPVEV